MSVLPRTVDRLWLYTKARLRRTLNDQMRCPDLAPISEGSTMANPPSIMAPEREALLQRLFADAAAMPIEELPSFLDNACQGDDTLRGEVEALLIASRESNAFLEVPAATLEDELVGTRIGRYTIVALLGEGGFGTVYRALQDPPMRREVALKIIKLGMDTRRVIARFDTERQALAILDHQGIAKVFDAGATASGRPYFVMEFVDGSPITAYCDSKKLSARCRLELFIPVCRALQHAHQKGIIHRDIKPNNVLVAVQDGVPTPKIIDFGIAKAAQAKLTERTHFTEARQLIGTPAYMSPEQAGVEGSDVDTRSDVYSMGVLLYDLLTGTTPIEAHSLREAAYDRMQQMIRDFEPPPPSARVTALGESAASVAALRSVGPRALSRSIRGEVDWIVMRCLEKSRDRRYQSAEALCDDLERHLRGDEVLARPAARTYRARKFIRRHAVSLSVSSLLLAVLIGALTATAVALLRESRALALAERANTDALGAVRASVGWGGRNHPTELLRENYNRVQTAYGDDNVQTITAAYGLANALSQDNDYHAAETLLSPTIERAQRVCGAHSPQLLSALISMMVCLNMQNKYEEALPFAARVMEVVDSDQIEASTAGYFAPTYGDQLTTTQRYEKARAPLLRALDIVRRRQPLAHGQMMGIYFQLAEGAEQLGDAEEASRWRQAAYSERRASLDAGPNNR